jgi:pyrroloquinoline quinone biosynthesis protein E
MAEPCRSCALKTQDFGGCRCQAFLLTGDARNADPVCTLSPHRAVVDAAIAEAKQPDRVALTPGSAATTAYRYRAPARDPRGVAAPG